MYTGVGRTWKNVSFSHVNSFGPNYVIPDMVMPLTGNTTVKMKINSYILSQPTPTPVFDSMRVDVSVFYAPQRLYTRGLIGDNFIETREIEDFDLPVMTINARNIPKWNPDTTTVGLVTDSSAYDGLMPSSFEDYAKRNYPQSALNAQYSAILPGSLLHRLGFPSLIFGPNFFKGLYDSDISPISANLWSIGQSSTESFGKIRQSFNMSVVCAYYDICRYFLSNLMTDRVPIATGSTTWLWAEDLASGDMVRTNIGLPLNVEFYSLASFGTFLNDVRGVSTANTVGNVTIPSMNNMFIESNSSIGARIKFNGVVLTDTIHGVVSYEDEADWLGTGKYLKNLISCAGLWPTRYDSHFQTMYFDARKVDSLMQVDWSNNVSSFRLAESEFATKLKRILRGMRYKSWVDVTFGARVKMDDHPIMLGKDSYYLTFQDIVNTGSQTSEIPLGASVGRGVGGNKTALRNKEDDVKEYVFTTQEPGYLMVLYSVVPQVSYANVLPRHLTWTKFGDFPIPQNSGKQFEPLIASDLSYSGTSSDDTVVGQQPIYFDAMTSFNKVSGVFATGLRQGYTFVRDFSNPKNIDGLDFSAYLGSTYVESGVFDQNFEDQGVNGRQNFNVKTHYDINVCVPLEDQVTDYNI